jgi:hypothetical protein
MNIDQMTIGEFKQLAALFGNGTTSKINPFSEWIGKKVFIRSVTHHYTGKVERLVGDESAILTTAAWIADSGRFADALAKSEFSEVEPYKNPVQINYGAVLDITEIDELPVEQK